MGCRCLSLDFCPILSSPPTSFASIQPHHRVLALARDGSALARGDGWLFLATRGRSPHASRDTWHRDGSQGPFPSSGASPAAPHPTASILNAPLSPHIPGSSAPRTAPALAQRLALHLPLPSLLHRHEKPGQTCPSRAPCPLPATLLRATTTKPDVCPSASLLCSGDALPGHSHSPGTGHADLAYFGAAATKIPPSGPSPPSCCPSCPLSVPSVPNSARSQPGPALHNVLLPARAASPAASHGIQGTGWSDCGEQPKPDQSTQKKRQKR